MKYPSIIFENDNRTKRNEYSVFSDLKLDLLLSEDTLNVISYYATPEDISNRAHIFSLLDDPKIRVTFEQLNAIAKKIKTAILKTQDTDSEVLRCILFVTAVKHYCDFARIAATPIDGHFGNRFSDHFNATVKGELALFEERVSILYSDCSRALEFEIFINPESASLGHITGENFEEKLTKCAEYFGAQTEAISNDVLFDHIIERAVSEYGTLKSELDGFYKEIYDKFDTSVCKYAEETGFYLEIYSLINRIKDWGIPVCRPEINEEYGINATEVYDFTLVAKNEKNIVPNDITLTDTSKFCFLRGANGGGKTTYLRCVGVNTVLALCGAPAAAKSFATYDYQTIYSHFPRDERFDRGGRLNDEEARLKTIKGHADNSSLVLLNETFSTTGAKQSDEMTAELARRIYSAGCTGIYVTHAKIDSSSDIPVLCVAVDPNDENRRTFRVEKETGSGGSFAEDILRRYNLDKRSLSERFGEI